MQSPIRSLRLSQIRLVFPVLLSALVVGALAQLAPAALAASGPFNGGPVAADCPTTVANDHTVYALRFTALSNGADPLPPNSQYYVKLRFTPSPDGKPAGVDNRGYTWNPGGNAGAGAWIQERESWTLFPTVTTDATGAIVPGPNSWYFVKFGDVGKTGAYKLLVSLSTGASGTTKNSDAPLSVNVISMTAGGYWVHDGASTGKVGKRVEVLDHAAPGNPMALQRTEANLCDDDGDGIVDNEQYGPVKAGGFRMAVPTGHTLDVLLQDALWPAASTGFAGTAADVDIALGAADQTPPTAPPALAAVPRSGGADLQWSAATDAAGVTGYEVYRWVDPPNGSGYSGDPVRIATVAAPTTTYSDSGLTDGTTYSYQVRAADAATNVGPRSPVASATPRLGGVLTLSAETTTVVWKGTTKVDGTLTDGQGAPLADRDQIKLQSSVDGSDWADVPREVTSSGPEGAFSFDTPRLQTATMLRAQWAGDEQYLGATSPAVTVTPRVKLGTPTAPSSVKKGRSFTVSGSLLPRQAPGSKTVQIRCYQRLGGTWSLKKTVSATNSNRGSATRYTARMSLPAKGGWKLEASFAATAQNAATTSGARQVRVR
jgi:hypothetical protein